MTSFNTISVPLIHSLDTFNYLLRSHHRRVSVIAYYIGKEMGLKHEDMLEMIIASSLHDIGALSIKERNKLLEEDVANPNAHCEMGYTMLNAFDSFKNVASIIKNHHSEYQESDRTVDLRSHIIHLSDRVDILISTNDNVLRQVDHVVKTIVSKKGAIFHPDVVDAFVRVSKQDVFWVEINNLEIVKIFEHIHVAVNDEVQQKDIIEFSRLLSMIIDFRSRFTIAHSHTVSKLSRFFGKVLGMSAEDQEKLEIAGLLHDIGKISMDPILFNKPEELTESEIEEMQLHPYYTMQMLEEISTEDWFSDIIQWAISHHERNDGQGYPFRDELGDDIGKKVVVYGDVISALMEDRAHRKKKTIEETLEIVGVEIAPLVDVSMFEELSKHKMEISEIVSQCYQDMLEIYTSVSERFEGDEIL